MARLTALLVSGSRHLLLAVAILVTLTAVFGVHVHLVVAQHHQHVAGERCVVGHAGHHGARYSVESTSLASGDASEEQGAGQGAALPDPDGCGHCHCQMPSTDLPAPLPVLADAGYTAVVHRSHDAVIPDGISFQPDPPPAKG